MKKLILLMGASYVVFLVSFKEPKEKPKSFSEMIKEDPARINELLKVADSINYSNFSGLTMAGTGEINGSTRDSLRKNKARIKKRPVIKVSITDMQNIIAELKKDDCDTLAFLLGSYKSKADVDRYNDRNAKGKKYTQKDLRKNPTFVISGQKKMFPANGNMEFLSAKTFDVARICPPPRGDCY